jgi:hypothetical protein
MSEIFIYQITSGPLDKEWLVAEIRFGDEHIADLVDWGDRLVINNSSGKFWNFPTNEFLTIIQEARERLRRMAQEN